MNIVIRYGIYQVEDKEISIELMCDRAIIAARGMVDKYQEKFAYYDDTVHKNFFQEQVLYKWYEKFSWK